MFTKFKTLNANILVIVSILILLTISFIKSDSNAYPGGGGKPSKSKIKVITKPITLTSNDKTYEAVGTGRAQFSADIHPAISDEVVDVLFESQQNVNKGDLLVQLDDRQEKLAVKLAKVKLKNNKSLLKRYQKAVKNGAVPQSEVDQAKANYDSAKLELEKAILSLEERQIKAPFDGVVGIPNIDSGDRVTPETLITGLDNRDILYIDFEVPESLAGELKKAQENKQQITATTPSYKGQIFTGYITAQGSRLNPSTRTIMARASIVNDQDILRPGMSFKTKWEIAGEQYPTVPEISLQWGREGSFVWVIKDGVAKKSMAQVIARTSGQVLVEGEINENDEVVIEGVQRLRPEVQVEVIGKK